MNNANMIRPDEKERYFLTQLRLERQSREAWQDGMTSRYNDWVEQTLKNEDLINNNFEIMREENGEAILAMRDKIGEFIERMVILEDKVTRLVNNEQLDSQGYTWVFRPEEAMQRIAALETEMGRQHHGIDPKIANRTREHLENIIKEKDERIAHLEKMLEKRNQDILYIGDQRPNGFIEINKVEA